MTDERKIARLDAKHERNRERRLEAVVRWAECVKEEPPEVWGPQQNAVVNAQIESAQATGLDADHHKRVRSLAGELAEEPIENRADGTSAEPVESNDEESADEADE
ncbi:hypothetical protein [Halopiger goleimassiliensis]|uniref:hypothetical protein n=1 Tax=Halopiger goleimassiliensis TaxID=1293048 RepID=UPI0009DC0801|nr:hypothetical protein [Halopiger goleimassiliensis]